MGATCFTPELWWEYLMRFKDAHPAGLMQINKPEQNGSAKYKALTDLEGNKRWIRINRIIIVAHTVKQRLAKHTKNQHPEKE